ncbi:MAG: hypothetical protein KBC34_00930 [Phenylobacterium sp.]|nr:hypothetical protein [Phenylobacterium sp.]
MPDRSKDYAWGQQEPFTTQALDKRFLDINARVLLVEIARLTENEAFAVVQDRVLSRAEAVIAALRARLLEVTQLDWLTATSSTPVLLEETAEVAIEIPLDQRDLFAPGPFAVLTRIGSPADYAVVRTLGFDRTSGQWDVKIEAFTGSPGPHSDWLITAIAGSALAQYSLLADGRAYRDQAQQARDVVEPLAGQVDADAQAVETARQQVDANAASVADALEQIEGFAQAIDPVAINRRINAARSFAIAASVIL